jgi:two-component system OmpR family response regulator
MSLSEPHILVVDDHRSIRDPLADYLQRNGFRATTAGNGTQAYAALKTAQIDLVVLDILMPGESGLDICRRIRETRDIPVILLTAVADETDRIVGLELGADDYVTKPFNPRELLARIRGVLRRVNSLPKQYSGLADGFMQFGPWQLDMSQRLLTRTDEPQEGEAVELSSVEFKLLATFLQHPRIVLSRDQLLDQVRGRAGTVFDRSIDNQVSRLRKKIEADPKKPEFIKTVWGGGYTFAADVVKL